MKDFLLFRKMITPVIVSVLFWVGVLSCLVIGISDVVSGGNASDGAGKVLWGLGILFLGPLAVRVVCEMVILLFAMGQRLSGIESSPVEVESQSQPAVSRKKESGESVRAAEPAEKQKVVIKPVVLPKTSVSSAKFNGNGSAVRQDEKKDTGAQADLAEAVAAKESGASFFGVEK